MTSLWMKQGAVVGAIVYIFITYKTGLLQDVFGKDIFDKILRKLHLKKRVIK